MELERLTIQPNSDPDSNVGYVNADTFTESGYVLMPNVVLLSKDIGMSEKLVFAGMRYISKLNNYCIKKQTEIGEAIKLSKNPVNKSLSNLATNNFIQTEKQGRNRPNKYYFNASVVLNKKKSKTLYRSGSGLDLSSMDNYTKYGYTTIPNKILLSSKLTAGQKMTYAIILARCFGDKTTCNPSQSNIGELLGCKAPAVSGYAKALAEMGFIKIIKGDFLVNDTYELLDIPKST